MRSSDLWRETIAWLGRIARFANVLSGPRARDCKEVILQPRAQYIRIYLYIEGMKGPACARHIESLIRAIPGISAVSVNNQSGVADIYCQPSQILEVASRVELGGYSVAQLQMFAALQRKQERASWPFRA